MLPCAGFSNVGQLTRLAVQELVLEGKGEWVRSGQDFELQALPKGTAESPSFVVVDGCAEQCGRKCLEALNYQLKSHLSLADLGIEKSEFTAIDHEELQLVKDAIIAEGTQLSAWHPLIMGGCCCR